MRDKQTKEAIRRMKALKMAEGVIIQFKDEGLLKLQCLEVVSATGQTKKS